MTCHKTSSTSRHSIDRRTLLKYSAATGAVLSVGVKSPAIAQTRAIKLGYVSTAHRAARRLCRSRQFHPRQFQGSDQGRHQDRQRHRAGRSHRQGQPVESEPRRRSRQGPDRPGQDRPDAGRIDAGDHQPGLDPMRDRGGAVHLDRGAVAALVHRPAGQSRRRAAGMEAFNYTYHFFWGLEDVIAVFTNMWSQLATNKSVGGLFPNDGDGNAWGDKVVGFPPVLDKGGYKLTDPGRYQNLTDNFSAQIAAFKAANCEIVTGVVLPPDFTTFWKQSLQQGFKPKVASIGKAILFPVAVEALGKDGHNLSSEVWWSPSHPFKSSLTGMSAKDLADCLSEPRPRSSGPSRSASSMRCSKSPSMCSSARRTATPRRSPRRSPRPISTPSSARCSGTAQPAAVRRQERRQDAAGRRPVAVQGRQIRYRHHRQQDGAGDSGRRPDGGHRLIALRVDASCCWKLPASGKASARSSSPTISISRRAGRGARHHRAERRRQDHAVQPDRRRPVADGGQHPLRRPRSLGRAAAWPLPRRHRPLPPDPAAVREAHRVREPAGRRGLWPPQDGARGGAVLRRDSRTARVC